MEVALGLEAFPACPVTLLLFESVSNSADIKRKLVANELAVDAAFIDADVIPGVFLVQLAAFKALAAQVGFSTLTTGLVAVSPCYILVRSRCDVSAASKLCLSHLENAGLLCRRQGRL